MKGHPLVAITLALTVLSPAAFAAPATSHQPISTSATHPYVDLDKIGVKAVGGTCTALENRFDKYLTSHAGQREPRVKGAVALRHEGISMCQAGMTRAGAVYLHSAIRTLIGRTAA